MKVPAEFEDVFQGVELTEREIGFLVWVAGWDSYTIENLKSVVQKARAKAEAKELKRPALKNCGISRKRS